jgi:hypothetical protein
MSDDGSVVRSSVGVAQCPAHDVRGVHVSPLAAPGRTAVPRSSLAVRARRRPTARTVSWDGVALPAEERDDADWAVWLVPQ